MNEKLILEVSQKENISPKQVKIVLELLSEGNTVPFISRYRKEATGNLDEEEIQRINKTFEYKEGLLKRKEAIINILKEKELLTAELEAAILKADKLVEVEDLYKPYKEKKKTKATEALKNGLEPLAKIIMEGKEIGNISNFFNEVIKTDEDAITGAKYIIAEWISDNAIYLKWIRNYTFSNGLILSKKKPKYDDEFKVYEIYYNFRANLKALKPHQNLAINRGEKEKALTVNIDIDTDKINEYLVRREVTIGNPHQKIIVEAIKDSYKRLIAPSINREIRSELTEYAEKEAIKLFSNNLEQLLLTKPMKQKIILGFDPAFRTGCKLAVTDGTGKLLEIAVIYPHAPQNQIKESADTISKLIKKHKVDIVAIGNGTASRESEKFMSDLIKEQKLDVKYVIVSEAGASVYSASKLAISEFPDLTVEKRSAISIARRLLDPLSELVKIDAKAIGIGQYQHDINQKELEEALTFTTEKVVNNVGVNVNTASVSLLKHVAGLSDTVAKNIIKEREDKGSIKNRKEIKKIKGLGPKAFLQSAGFLRILEGKNELDATAIHPESYDKTYQLLSYLNLDLKNLDKEKLTNIDYLELTKELAIDEYTLKDIVEALLKPSRDPRDDFAAPILKSDILKITDLKVGMQLEGTVRNIVDFGAFIDIGLKNDGLAHISKLTNRFIKHPLEVVNIGEIVTCYIDDIYLEKKKVSLSLIKKE